MTALIVTWVFCSLLVLLRVSKLNSPAVFKACAVLAGPIVLMLIAIMFAVYEITTEEVWPDEY